MNNHMKLLHNHDKNMINKLHIGGEIKFNGGFPNLVKNIEIKKKEYQYNIDTLLETEKINIKNILIKRKEGSAPLINFDEDEDIHLIKKTEEYTTNINIDDLI